MSAGMLGVVQMVGGIGVFVPSMLVKPLNRRFGPGVTIVIRIGATVAGFAADTRGPTGAVRQSERRAAACRRLTLI